MKARFLLSAVLPALLLPAPALGQLTINEEGEPALKFGGYMQFRYGGSFADNISGTDRDIAAGFMMRRAKLSMETDFADDRAHTKTVIAVNRSTGTVFLEDMFIEYDLTDTVSVRAGQFKMALLREENISSTRQLTAERSHTNRAFTQAFSQGVQVTIDPSEQSRWTLSVNDGLGQFNTAFTNETADFAATGRYDHYFQGNRRRFRDMTSFRGQEFASTIGAAAHFETGGETIGTTDRDIFQWTVDGSLEGDGWNAYGAVIGRTTDAAGMDEFTDWGVIGQAGFFISDDTELFARYDALIPDGDRVNDELFQTITGGANWFLVPESHAAKVTGDVGISFGEQDMSIAPATSATGLVATSDDTQVVARIQILLMF